MCNDVVFMVVSLGMVWVGFGDMGLCSCLKLYGR